MIAGRPTSLWLAAITAIINFGAGLAASNGVTITVEQLAGINTVVMLVIALIANQPPQLSPGDSYKIVTPKGQPNYDATVAVPPAATAPVADTGPK